ncbi:HI0074 family nucleotidyltransferase substrate-binding subunit [Limnohabitans sp.]|uniref:HI0074 family nucleotidyltransferase substrate-binding subunit n=1 Tax=Limnohabitans sp. TaxID=1907725 RepID=UPI00286EE131|nr:HI0074 family nucleotidyltransferase substrate-binding subunit [Limnohabitans sp.]
MAYRDRFELAREQYRKALTRLHEVVALNETDVVRDSLIQRFDFTYELAWKSMFYWMKDQGEQVPEMQKPILQAAFRCGLILDPQLWEDIKEQRDETSHTYNEDKAVFVSAYVRTQAMPAFDAWLEKLNAL